ncbi:hypothetical protein DdX_05802 [Ditylenchus destructor]|uniref:Uncharacterized protein n=1 Tax=Ditylenchus destructor TaxID=166010 RepID=A0AAD4NAC3_9BILA|nr:hypothetical protein DdX_05802 [Ditylenchus destructor]
MSNPRGKLLALKASNVAPRTFTAQIGYLEEKTGAGLQGANNPGAFSSSSGGRGGRGGRGGAQIGYMEESTGAGLQAANNPGAFNSSSGGRGGRGGRGGSQTNAPTEQRFEVKQETEVPQFGNYARGRGSSRGRGGNVQSAPVNESATGYQKENQPPVESSIRGAHGGIGGRGGSRIDTQVPMEPTNASQDTADVQGTVQTIPRGGAVRGGSDNYYETTPTEYPAILPPQNADVKEGNTVKLFSNHLAESTKPAVNNNIAVRDQTSTDETQKELTGLIADLSVVMSRMSKLAQKLCQ